MTNVSTGWTTTVIELVIMIELDIMIVIKQVLEWRKSFGDDNIWFYCPKVYENCWNFEIGKQFDYIMT